MDREKSLSQKFYFVIAIFITVVCSPLELPEPIKGFLIWVHFKHVATFYRLLQILQNVLQMPYNFS